MKRNKRLPAVLVLICFLALLSWQVSAAEQALTLDEAVATSLQFNPLVEIATEQCVQGQGIFTQARSGYLPRVSVGGDVSRQYYKNLQPVDEDTVGRGSVSLSQLIYDFGKTTGAIDSSRFSLQASEANLHQLMQDVVLDARAAFYSVLEKARLVTVAEEAVSNYEQQLYRAQRYYEAGVRTRIDVTNAQVNLSNTRLELVQAEADLQTARVVLENVLGVRPNDGRYNLVSNEGELANLAASKPAMPQSLDVLLATAFANRADVRQVDLLVKASQSDITVARSGYFPSIDATGRYDDYETDLVNLDDQWNLGVGLTWEIFSGFQTEGELVEARARYRELQSSLRELQLAITREVTESYLRADENRKAVDLADESLGLAVENLALAEGRYKAGLNDILEFNDAQLNLTTAQSNLVTTYYAYLTALARIENTTGITTGLTVAAGDAMSCQAMLWQAQGP